MKEVSGSSIVTPFLVAGIVPNTRWPHHLKHGTAIDYVQSSCGVTGVRRRTCTSLQHKSWIIFLTAERCHLYPISSHDPHIQDVRSAPLYSIAEVSRKLMQSYYAQLQPTTSFVPPVPATLHASLAFAITPQDVATLPLGFATIISPTVYYTAAEPDPTPLPCADVWNVQVRL